MANKFITLEKAKAEIKRLQYYVNLVEKYEPINLEQQIVKEYAITSCLTEVSGV